MDSVAEPSRRAFLTLDAIRAEHGRLLDLAPDAVTGVADYVRQVRDFVGRLVESGVYFDELGERRAIQGYLDHWMGELSSRASAEQSADLIHLELRAFDVAALRALQDTLVNPFATVSVDIATLIAMLSDGSRRSATPILKWLEERSKAAGLRFQDGLLKEIASQVAVDPEGATLLEFCLWHLFEDPATRIGNKIKRPEGELTFVCVGYLAEHAEKLCAAQPEPAQAALIAALAAFEPSPSGDDLAGQASARIITGNDTARFALYQRRDLALKDFLPASRLAFLTTGGRLRLVHRALLSRWNAVAVARAARLERAKGNRQKWYTVGGLVGVLLLGGLVWTIVDGANQRSALQHAARAANEGAQATASLLAYSRAYQGNSDRVALYAAMDSSRRYYVEQIRSGISAVKRYDSLHSRKSLNDAISGAMGFLAQVGAVGELPRYALVMSGEEASEAPPKGCGAPFCLTDGIDKVAIGGGEGKVAAAVLNHDGSRLAAVVNRQGTLVLRVFALGLDGLEAPSASGKGLSLGPWREIAVPLKCHVEETGKDPPSPSLRFRPGGSEIVLDCGDGQAAYVEIKGEQLTVQTLSNMDIRAGSRPESSLLKCDLAKDPTRVEQQDPTKIEEERRAGLVLSENGAIFLGSDVPAGQHGSVITTGSGGYVRVWSMAVGAKDAEQRCPSAQFFSDFVRVVTGGYPSALAFHQDSDSAESRFAILDSSQTPVIRVYEQRDPNHAEQVIEHYPQYGLGTPVAVGFTSKGCLEVHARRKKPLTSLKDEDHHYVRLPYYLILDAKQQRKVAEALENDLESLSPLERENGLGKRWENLPQYRQAIDDNCGVRLG